MVPTPSLNAAEESTPRGRTRKAVKRALCPFINHKIIDVADCCDVVGLVRLIQQYLPDMNLVNLTTSLHRLARLSSERPDLQALLHSDPFDQVLVDLLGAIADSLLTSDPQLNDSRRQALSNIIWSLGTLRCVHLQLVQITVALASEQLYFFKPYELASTVWAFAKLGTLHQGVHDLVAPLLSQALSPVASVVDKLGFRFLTMVAWAMVASGQHHEHLFWRLGGRLLAMMRRAECSPELLLDMACAFGSSGAAHQMLLCEVVDRSAQLQEGFLGESWAALCRALTASGVDCTSLAVASTRRWAVGADPAEVVEVLCAFARAPQSAGATGALLLLIGQSSGQLLGTLDAVSLVTLAGAVAQHFCHLQEALPCEAAKFLAAAEDALRRVLPCLTGVELVGLVLASTEVPLAVLDVYYDIAQQVIDKLDALPPLVLLQLLQHQPGPWSPAWTPLVPAVLTEVTQRLAEFSAAELQTLAQVVGAQLGLTSCPATHYEELAALCRRLCDQHWADRQPLHPLPPPRPGLQGWGWGTQPERLSTMIEDDGGADCVDTAFAVALGATGSAAADSETGSSWLSEPSSGGTPSEALTPSKHQHGAPSWDEGGLGRPAAGRAAALGGSGCGAAAWPVA